MRAEIVSITFRHRADLFHTNKSKAAALNAEGVDGAIIRLRQGGSVNHSTANAAVFRPCKLMQSFRMRHQWSQIDYDLANDTEM
jgi:hypothetical protein